MGLKKISYIIISIILFNTCNIFDKGYIDENGQYVPKKDRYLLKRKKQI